MGRVAHFEIVASDPQQAATFYNGVFGWEIRPWDGHGEYLLVLTGEDDEVPGINGAIVHRSQSPAGSVNLVDVVSLDTAMMRVAKNGGTIVHTRTTVPGVGYVAYCRDPEGNAFGLIERSPTAS
ncbi:MAG: VOC family protein [Candidatus Latescibacterota bacterium]|nr:VOC family protein [Candidatus Latescibacterota bacterium]